MFDGVRYSYDAKTQVYTFSSNFGINFRRYIMNSIVGSKKFDLLFRNLNFKEIVIDMDFPNISFFGRFVKSMLGMSPREYREKLRKKK